jgi:hypothetical protein
LTVDNSRFESNVGHGLHIAGDTLAVVTNSVASKNGETGINSSTARTSVSRTTVAHNKVGFNVVGSFTLDSSSAHGNNVGLLVSGNATVARISNSIFVTNFDFGIQIFSGTALTLGNNIASGNTANVQGTLTALGGI